VWVVNEGYKAANQVQVGDALISETGEWIKVTDISHQQGKFTVYNFEVEGAHSYFAGKDRVLVHNKCRLPRAGGLWAGEAGDGLWFSSKTEVNQITDGQGIQFKNGRPDFSPWSKGSIEFEPGQLNGTDSDFGLVYKAIAKEKNLPSAAAAENYLREAGLTPHHVDNTTIQLIPTALHKNVPHIGSASDLRMLYYGY
jgi:hypothetical protein